MSERELELTIATLEVLTAMGDCMIGAIGLERSVRLKTTPKATPTEVQERIRWCENRGLILSVRNDVGLLYQIKPAGRAWLLTNG